MKIMNLTKESLIYTSNVYLITGTWNCLKDANTLIDVGRDPSVIEKINNAPTGVGKHKVEQVVLTHNHYDHTNILPLIRKVFNPIVYASSPSLGGVDYLLKDGDPLKLGDRIFEVIYTPGHSNDSICVICEEEGVLFAGDTGLVITTASGTYEEGFVHALEKLCRRDIRSVYFGHGPPLVDKCNAIIRSTLKNVRQSLRNGSNPNSKIKNGRG